MVTVETLTTMTTVIETMPAVAKPQRAVLLDCFESYVSRILVLPGDRFVAISFYDGGPRVYDMHNGSLKYTIIEHQSAVYCLASLGTDLAASGDASGLLCVWRATTGKCLFQRRQEGGQIWSIAKLDAFRFIVSVGNAGLFVFNHSNGDSISISRALPSKFPDCILNISICGDRMVTTSFNQKAAKVWDVDSLTEVSVLDDGTNGKEPGLQLVALDSKHIVSREKRGGQNDAFSIWDTKTCTLSHKIVLPHQVSSLIVLDDGHALTTSASDTIVLVDLHAGRVVYSFKVPLAISHMAVSRDGRIVLGGGKEYALIFLPPPPIAGSLCGRRV